jgi:hypothetical protein
MNHIKYDFVIVAGDNTMIQETIMLNRVKTR